MAEKVDSSWGQAQADAPVDRRAWWALAAVLTGAFMILLDGTIINVAVPVIKTDLSASYASIEWVISGYVLAYGLLLIPAGRVGDRYGHRAVLLVGMTGFVVLSVLCATAQSPAQLVLYRVLQGAMAGILNPQVLAVIQLTFPDRQRGKAYGIYGAVSGIGVALGPVLGGALIQANIGGTSWRPIFLINVPVGIVAIAMTLRLVKETRGRAGSLDPLGILLVSAAVLLLSIPLIQGQSAGWPAWTWISFGGAAAALAAFIGWEVRTGRRGGSPLIDMNLFRNRAFSAGVGIGLAYFAGFISLFFLLSLLLQSGLHKTALIAGLIILPFALGTFLGAAVSDGFAKRLGRGVLALGCSMVAVGIAATVLVLRARGAGLLGWELIAPLGFGGIGSGLVIAPNVSLVLEHVPWQDAGAASGILNTAQRVGQALGVAIAGAALASELARPGAGSAAAHYSHATQIASLYSLGLVVVALALVFVIPKRSASSTGTW
jgi:EmrB/QacA subfamily drug resistance transporter